MSKSIIILILIVILDIVAFVVLNEVSNRQHSLHRIIAITSPTPIPENIVSLSPSNLTVRPGKETAVNIILESETLLPSLVQIELAYDPLLLTNIRIVPGTFLNSPTIALNSNDETTGRISYALQTSSAKKSAERKGILAVLYFTPRSGVIAKQTVITFLPKTLTHTDGQKNTLKAAYGTKITFENLLTPKASSPALLKIK